MDPSRFIALYYLSSVAGLFMVAGGIWLIYKEKIYIDKESKEVTEIETPIGKFKTNIPALALFILGFIPLIYPLVKSGEITKETTKEMKIMGSVKSSTHPVQVYAVIESDSLMQDREFSLWVPTSSKEYRVIYIARNIVLEDIADPKGKKSEEIKLPGKEILAAGTESFEPDVSSVPQEFR